MPIRVVALPLVAIAMVVTMSCAGADESARSDGKVSVYVLDKQMPLGMLVGTAKTNGVLVVSAVPADVAGSDALTDTTGLECLVAGQNLPAGTIARRKLFVEPSAIGLTGGLTGGTGARPAGC